MNAFHLSLSHFTRISFLHSRQLTLLTSLTSLEDLDILERRAFYKWRGQLSELSEKMGLELTPFEKNLEYWRQLWRVCERSSIVVQVVDGRHPLLYRSPDLETYVSELNPTNRSIVLINKSDFLPSEAREAWHNYFKAKGVEVLFFSALRELQHQGVVKLKTHVDSSLSQSTFSTQHHQEIGDFKPHKPQYLRSATPIVPVQKDDKFEKVMPDIREEEDDDEEQNPKNTSLSPSNITQPAIESLGSQSPHTHQLEAATCDVLDVGYGPFADERHGVPWDILSVLELKMQLTRMAKEQRDTFLASETPTTSTRDAVIGMVGFPNVGKSSVINSLMGEVKASMSRQPGKTKHFQTLLLPGGDVTLCDCPGLVFPTVVASRYFLLLNGIVPIDSFRGEITAAAQLICDRVPGTLCHYYGVTPPPSAWLQQRGKADKRLVATEFMDAVAKSRSYTMAGRGGLPDRGRVARMMLRDYCTGKVVHFELPPNFAPTIGSALLSDQNLPLPGAKVADDDIINDDLAGIFEELKASKNEAIHSKSKHSGKKFHVNKGRGATCMG
eukprot:GHVN01040778.1.p1 GENE.GHVN01040778.1~~GHVN01040778.1.p1  ORF type:complete len:600 (-),score=101.83 GHVN01040778.1:808-2472(-)